MLTSTAKRQNSGPDQVLARPMRVFLGGTLKDVQKHAKTRKNTKNRSIETRPTGRMTDWVGLSDSEELLGGVGASGISIG
jgi:hypothetical protein